MSRVARIEINEGWCKGCEICVDVCPRDVLEMKDFVAIVKNLEMCTGCMLCEQLCPDFAIVVHPPQKKKVVVE
jgi:NAD-dependent dihydropyrimidine dehydrogenase PreA subunit